MAATLSHPCPSQSELADYSSGKVTPRACEVISQHVATCDACVTTLHAVESAKNIVAQALRQPTPDNSLFREQECGQMLQRVHSALGQAKPSASSPAETLPRQFGRYRLLRSLGQGGMGTVYAAYDTQLEREVALKLPHLEGQAIHTRERFLREARAAATIVHPNVCPIYDVGEIDGHPFLIMQLVRGESLATRLQRVPAIDQHTAVIMIAQLARALAVAHRSGIIHRDIKPANILLTEQGVPLLTDFGLAQRLAPTESELTQAGQILGTPSYMSPEQARGNQANIGPAADIYSLGAVFYELLTGRRPFVGTAVEILAAVIHQMPTRPASLRPQLDPRIEQVCLRAMAKPIAERYASMDDFATALENLLAPSTARIVTAVGQPPSKIRSPARMMGVIAAVILAGIVIVLSDSRGTVAIRIHGQEVTLRLIPEQGEPSTVNRDHPRLFLSPGTYKVEVVGKPAEVVRVEPTTFQLKRRGKETIDVFDLPKGIAPPIADKPALEKSATEKSVAPPSSPVRFQLALNGLAPTPFFTPVGKIPDWQHENVFAELRSAGDLEYPVLPTVSYVLESEVTLRQPQCFLLFEVGDSKFRVIQRLEWDEGRSAYKCKLQRYHGRGTWFIHWKHFPLDQRLKFRFVMFEGMAVLYEGESIILSNPSIAVRPQLRIHFGGEGPGNATIHSCQFRPLTKQEEQDAIGLKPKPEEPKPDKQN